VCVITNGILTSRTVEMVEDFKISKVMISLDGTRETYLRLRGLDVYERVMETIRLLKDRVKVAINFTITPWNDATDYEHVRRICEDNELEFGLPNLYTTQPYFKTVEPPGLIEGKHEKAVTRDAFQRRYLDYHDPWLRGELKLPCLSIFRSAIIYPEGDVSFCHQRVEILGNLHQQSLDEIWNSESTRKMQDQYIGCNKCWCTPHRLQDVYSENLGKAILLKERASEFLRGK
jgi:MoaA/NifB/PqqE/SkfB family radical SAM enzyme